MIPKYPQVIQRMSDPNTYDHAPYGTLCITNDGKVFKQIHKDSDKPIWDNITHALNEKDSLIVNAHKDL